ncbi:MAG: hypothetical protein ACKVUS_00485 [Saprospiraceae bacterium]
MLHLVSSAVRPAKLGQMALLITPKTFPNKNSHPSKILHCDVVFGSPSMDCNGTGICKITGTHAVRHLHLKKDCRLTFGQIAAAPEGKISLFFFREFLCTRLYRQHFRKGVLVLKEPCALPKEIYKALDIKGKTLLSGDYAVVECDGYFRVDVDCA